MACRHAFDAQQVMCGTGSPAVPSNGSMNELRLSGLYRGYAVGVASKLATVIYVAMVMPILYDNSYSPTNSNLKYESYWLYG